MRRIGIVAIALGAVLASGVGIVVATKGGGGMPGKEAKATARYRCPMHASYTSDKRPADLRMKLVPMEEEAPLRPV
jgi:hypothetical protein